MTVHAASSPGHPDSILKDIAGKLPVRPNARKRMIWMICMGIGLIALIYLFVSEPKRAWGTYTINTLYFLGITNGAMVLACAIRLGNGRWAGPVIRIAESMSAYYPFGIGLFYNFTFDDDAGMQQAMVAYYAQDRTDLPTYLTTVTGDTIELLFLRTSSIEELQTDVREERADLGLIVPDGFDEAVRAGQQPELQVV